MKKILKYVGLATLGLTGLLLFVANFSVVESSFQCSGKVSDNDKDEPLTVYIKLEEYRWWVGLWGDSDGALYIEIPNEWVDYFGRVDESRDQLQIYTSNPQKTLKGNFSKLSKTLLIETPFGFFDGVCNVTD